MTVVDNWVVLQLKETPNSKPVYKVLAGFSGGYRIGDSWRLNSGIKKVSEDEDNFYFDGYSGSTYICFKENYNLSSITQSILNDIKEHLKYKAGEVVVLDSSTEWNKLDFDYEE